MEFQGEKSTEQSLPILKYKQAIIKHISNQSAIIISGLTGCGKSTQVPQYLLEAFPEANIAVCEPRRLAATSLAIRVCEQQKAKLGQQIGYQIGLESKRSEKTKLVYMTYGILIQQLLFKQNLDYDFVILDEVHERSLEMDFAFVILKKFINQNLKEKRKNNAKTQKSKVQESVSLKKKDSPEQTEILKKDKSQKPFASVTKQQKKLKLIIMSATINSGQFQKYFSVHKVTSFIIEPQIVIRQVTEDVKKRKGTREPQKRRGNVDLESFVEPKKQIQITYNNLEDYREGICVFIDEKSPYTVKQYYLQDFLPYFQEKIPSRNYENRDQIRLEEKHYSWGLKLIDKALRDLEYFSRNTDDLKQVKQKAGDILVFLPGLVQINRMKETLIQSKKQFSQKIVEVHSLFSEELYDKLFRSKIENKIILATNIGQSSITLPNCKVVIDYCLNRKAVKNDQEGISRFSTRVASLSNLVQRKGRVGRVSDGTVYRMITKGQFENLEEFDVPEIKCVSLQMAILKTKKLQSTSRSHIFEDVYDIFLNVLEPPQLQSIQSAIDNLIHEDALQYIEEAEQFEFKLENDKKEEKRKHNSGKKYDGRRLKITKVGQFMVSMPCDLGISKMILMGIKLGISSIIIDIAAIILSTKSFFCHEQRRYNIQEYMHAIIGYDKGHNNDFLLRQRLFEHWRLIFYIPFRDKHKPNAQLKTKKSKDFESSFRIFENFQETQFDQNYKIVDKFVRKKESDEQLKFCKNRGVYANHMRQLLRLSETLKIRIEMIGVNKQKLSSRQSQPQLVLICLMYAFPDVICSVDFQTKKRNIEHVFERGQTFDNKVFIPWVKDLTKKELQGYLDPERQYETKELQDALMVSTYDHVLKKFFLPKHYTKSPSEKCSVLFNHCKLSKIKYPYEYNVYNGFSNVMILNESINKEIFITRDMMFQNRVEKKYLISNNLIESKGRYMVAANALISHFELVIISMIVKKNIKMCLHPSGQFFSHIKLNNDKKFQTPLIFDEEQLKLINTLRTLSKRKKQEQIASEQQQFQPQQLQTLLKLFKLQNLKPLEQDWEQLFIEEQRRINEGFDHKYEKQQQTYREDQWISIEHAENMMKQVKGKKYHQRYHEWKKYLYQSSERQYKLNSTTEPILICGHCHLKQKIVEIESAFSLEFHTGTLKLNKYSGSWQSPDSKGQDISGPGFKIYCSNMHHIATSIDQDRAQIDMLNVYLYVPFNKIFTLAKIPTVEQYGQILTEAKEHAANDLKGQHLKLDTYECKICYNRQSHKVIFQRNETQHNRRQKKQKIVKDSFWNTILNHIISTNHITNKQRLKRSIIQN